MNICLFTPEEIDKPLNIRDPRAEHIIKILHKKVSDSFSAGIIDGPAGHAVITALDVEEKTAGSKVFKEGTLSFKFTPESDGKPLYPLIMIIGFPRPIQLKRLLRDMAGLGVQEIHLTATELGEKSYLNSNLATGDAGYQMLLEGTEQAAGTHVPGLFMHENLKSCIEAVEGRVRDVFKWDGCERLCLDNVKPACGLPEFLGRNAPEHAVAAIGSERGWTQNERSLLESAGFTRLGMGCRVLRTETAATVAASLILGQFGFLG